VDGQARLPVAAAGQGGEDGHGGVAVLKQKDPLQSTSGPRGNPFPGQSVQEQLGMS